VSTLVLCVDRSGGIDEVSGLSMPVVGWDAIQSLVIDIGVVDPEDSIINCLLEALRVTRDLQNSEADPVVAIVTGAGESLVNADRRLAQQVESLVNRYGVDSAIVVIDSASDEQVVPVIESRLTVDAVDRVVVRQAHDIQSTYYLLKQFLADEELRTTFLVPLGTALLIMPVLVLQFSPTVAIAGLAALLGGVLLYKGLAIDEHLAEVPERIQTALYSGRVSVVTYAVGVGLAFIGAFLGALSVTPQLSPGSVLVRTMQFVYNAVPWLALAALTVSAGRLLDEFIESETVSRPYLNLPFGVVALGFVIRGFAGWFLQRKDVLINQSAFGHVITAQQRLAGYIIGGIIISLIGVRIAASITSESPEDVPQ